MHVTTEVVGTPEVREDGCVVFTVLVGAETVMITASPLGFGVSADVTLDVAAAAIQAVERFVRPRGEEMRNYYREAAKLRRERGNPALVDRTLAAGAQLALPPERRNDAAVFRVRIGETELRVFLFRDGTIIDDCDHWERVTDAGRKAAMAAAINCVLAHPTEAALWGLDVELVQELWE